MKHYSFIAVAFFTLFGSCREAAVKPDLTLVNSFVQAVPVWAEGQDTVKNQTLSFRQVIESKNPRSAYIRLAASADYRLSVNGTFVAHGPCVAAHDFYRIDSYELTPYLICDRNVIAVEVAGYNESSYYLLNQPSFLQAEVEVDGTVVAATGTDFEAYDLRQRKADVPRFSFQRPFTEYYTLKPDYGDWATKADWTTDRQPVKLARTPDKKLIVRRVPHPDYRIHGAKAMNDSIYKFDCNSSGFLGLHVRVDKPSKLRVYFDELLGEDGVVHIERLGCRAYVIYELQPGEYDLESFEPYTMQYVQYAFDEGDGQVGKVYMRDYCGADVQRAKFASDNDELNRLFEAARETHRQNALDIFMDCPSRERAGWLCDSYFSARVAFDFSGNTKIEKNFIENFLLPEEFKDINRGMLPMCYPSDHWNHNYIPNWAMWFVLELEEYLHRSGDRALIDQAKRRVYDLADYFKPYLNEDGLLEKLDKWVFVEWSDANKYVQDVNYPSNMLYAEMLDVMSRLYGDEALHAQAEGVREQIRRQSYDGRFFCDNAVRKNGKLERTANHTEACQYYAFYLKSATPETYPELWKRLRDEFGPARKQYNPYPDVAFANAFIGNYLRLEILSRAGLSKQLLDESVAEYLIMADRTGTLWENMTPTASCNHGFAAHIERVLMRDILGVYDVSPTEKKVTLRFVDTGLKHCRGTLPVGDEHIELDWNIEDGVLKYELALPREYRAEIIPATESGLKDIVKL